MNEQEYVDIYNENKEKTGKVKVRHRNFDNLEEGEYILGVQAIIINSKNEILISQRSENKMAYPLLWECNGGCVDADESGIQGVVREVKEELGIDFKESEGIFFKSVKKEFQFKDLYLFKKDINIDDLEFSDKEALQAKWITIDEFEEMFENNEIVPNIDFTRDDYEKCLRIINKREIDSDKELEL